MVLHNGGLVHTVRVNIPIVWGIQIDKADKIIHMNSLLSGRRVVVPSNINLIVRGDEDIMAHIKYSFDTVNQEFVMEFFVI